MNGASSLYREFMENGKSADCPVYDMHGHMGFFRGAYLPFPGPGEMVERMKLAGVEMVVFSHHTALSAPDMQNRKSMEAVRLFPGFLKAYCVINPCYPGNTEQELKAYPRNQDVYAGLKMHPDSHKTPLTHAGYRRAFEFADDMELPVLIHTWGGSIHDGEEEVRKIAEKYRRARLILGHSLHGAWEEAARIAGAFGNVFLELTAVLDERSGILEMFVDKAGSEKILFGTDFPWFNHHYYIGAVLGADITDDDRRNIFYRNAKKILGVD